MKLYFKVFVFATSIALFTKLFVIDTFHIVSSSMEPTLKVGQLVFVNKLTFLFRVPRKGDIVVFKLQNRPQERFVKRVVAVSGEKIVVGNKEYYVPKNQIFVLGDNRESSEDSRIWGSLPIENLIGTLFFFNVEI